MAGTLNQENKLMFFGLYVATGLVGIVANAVILRTFWRHRRGSYLHLQLAVANIINLASITMSGPSALSGKWLFGDAVCSWFGVQAFSAGFAVTVFICLISIESYLATQHSSLYMKLSPGVLKSISAGAWLYSVLFAVAPLLGWNRFVRERHGTSCGIDLHTYSASITSYLVTTQTVFLVIAFAAVVCVTLALAKHRDDSNVFGSLFTDRELIKVAGALLLLLGICTAPYYIRVLWYLLGYKPVFNNFLGVEFSHLAMKFGSAAHPFAYFLLSRKFRTTCLGLTTGGNQITDERT